MTEEIDKARFRKGLTHKSVIGDSLSKRAKNRSLSPFYSNKTSLIASSPQNATDETSEDSEMDFRRSETVFFESRALTQSCLITDDGRGSICFPDTPIKQEVKKDTRSLTQENWAHELICFNCKKRFDKLRGILRHHCRNCGKSVCAECSTRKISDQRACEICYYQSLDDEETIKRKHFMAYVDQILKEKQEEVVQWEQKIQEKEEENLQYFQKAKSTIETLERDCQNHANEYNRLKSVLTQKIQTNEYFKKAVQTNEGLFNDASKACSASETKIKQLKLDIVGYNHSYLLKIEELNQKNFMLTKLKEVNKQHALPEKNMRNMNMSMISQAESNFEDSFIAMERDRSSTTTSYALRQPSILANHNKNGSFMDVDEVNETKKRRWGWGLGFFNCSG